MTDYKINELIAVLKQINKSLKDISRNLNHIAFPEKEGEDEDGEER